MNSNHSGRSPVVCLLLSFLFLFCDFGDSRRFSGACLSLRSVAGLEEVLDESCGSGSYVEDELVPELDDNPRTTRGTKFSVLHKKFFPSLVWLVTTGPLVGMSTFFAELSKR